MTGPEHYREAERLLEDTLLPNGLDYEILLDTEDKTSANLQAAQVHATLAQVALLAVTPPASYISNSHARAWAEAVTP